MTILHFREHSTPFSCFLVVVETQGMNVSCKHLELQPCVFHCGPAGREVEIFVEALQTGRMLVPRRSVSLPLKLCKFKIPNAHGQKTTPLTPHRILVKIANSWTDVGTAESHCNCQCFAASKTLNSSAYSAEVPCL